MLTYGMSLMTNLHITYDKIKSTTCYTFFFYLFFLHLIWWLWPKLNCFYFFLNFRFCALYRVINGNTGIAEAERRDEIESTR